MAAFIVVCCAVMAVASATIGIRDFSMLEMCEESFILDNRTYINSMQLMLTNWNRDLYPANVNCGLHIRAPEGHSLVLKFIAIDMPCGDYVEIHEGRRVGIALLERTCEKRLPSDVVSEGRDVYIKFHSDEQNQGFGFHLLITSFHTDTERCSKHNDFLCANGRCINSGLSCNFQDNCGDGSNNAHCGHKGGHPTDQDWGDDVRFWGCRLGKRRTLMIALPIAGATFILLVVGICCCCKKVKRRSASDFNFKKLPKQHLELNRDMIAEPLPEKKPLEQLSVKNV